MSDNLPPLPERVATIGTDGHPRHIRHLWGALEARNYGPPAPLFTADQLHAYAVAWGQQCRAQALEEAALRFERVGGMIDPRSIAAAIRALKNETCHKGGRNEG